MSAQFLSGAIMMASLVAGLVFLRFWRQTRDRLFATFALSFWLMALERLILAAIEPVDETRTFVHMIRLMAFLLIVVAIIDKNRGASRAAAAR
jgi:hypothetical protein